VIGSSSTQKHREADRLEITLDDLTVFDGPMASVFETGYGPAIDDGDMANLLPLQEAGC
jgi:hypothetical protein